MLRFAARDDRFDPAEHELVAVAVGVVGAVGEQRVRSAAGTAWQAGNCRYSIDERQQLGHVVAVRRGHRPRQREAAAVYEEVVLGARTAPIDRARARFGAPFFACT